MRRSPDVLLRRASRSMESASNSPHTTISAAIYAVLNSSEPLIRLDLLWTLLRGRPPAPRQASPDLHSKSAGLDGRPIAAYICSAARAARALCPFGPETLHETGRSRTGIGDPTSRYSSLRPQLSVDIPDPRRRMDQPPASQPTQQDMAKSAGSGNHHEFDDTGSRSGWGTSAHSSCDTVSGGKSSDPVPMTDVEAKALTKTTGSGICWPGPINDDGARTGSEGGRDAPEEERYRRRGASVAQPRDLKSDGWFVGSCGTSENEGPR